MMHQFRDKKQRDKRKNFIRNVLLFGIFLLLAISGALMASGRFFSIIGRPIWKANNSIMNTSEDLGYLVRTKSSVFAENEALRRRNNDLYSIMTDYQILKSENIQLKELLGRLPINHTYTLAAILAKPNRSPYDTMIIDGGSDVGIIEGQLVFAGTIPIGEISKVNSKDSLVMLYSNPGQMVDAMIDGSNTAVELIGRGGGNFEMTIPIDLQVDKGALVVFPNINGPEVVAIVDGIISAPTDPIKKIILHSPVNIQNLKWVQVKKN